MATEAVGMQLLNLLKITGGDELSESCTTEDELPKKNATSSVDETEAILSETCMKSDELAQSVTIATAPLDIVTKMVDEPPTDEAMPPLSITDVPNTAGGDSGSTMTQHSTSTPTSRSSRIATKTTPTDLSVALLKSVALLSHHANVFNKDAGQVAVEITEETPVVWHTLTAEEILLELKSQKNGLSTEEATKRLALYGKNCITPPKVTHWFVKFLWNLFGGFQLMLWVGSLLCLIVFGITYKTSPDIQTLALGIVLILVIFITCIFQSYQEGKSSKVMAALRALAPLSVYCYRDGILNSIPAENLVIGDIVKVSQGEKVPADVRVLEGNDLKVNNASLTGENVDIKLGPNANHERFTEAKNIAMSGCNFTSGNALCVVFATGDNTCFGKISFATTQTKTPDTLLKAEIRRLITIMAAIAITLGVVFLILALLNGYKWLDAVVFCIGIIVAK